MKKPSTITYLDVLPPMLNALRLYRRLRAMGKPVCWHGKFARHVRHCAALKKLGQRRHLAAQVPV